jgi:hypothetical protein
MRSMRGLTVAHEIHLCLRLWAGDRGCSGGNRILKKWLPVLLGQTLPKEALLFKGFTSVETKFT